MRLRSVYINQRQLSIRVLIADKEYLDKRVRDHHSKTQSKYLPD